MFDLPPLGYSESALAPHMSATTLQFHHGKHHQGYVEATNAQIADTDLAEASLEDVIRASVSRNDKGLFNKAGQMYAHNLFWQSMRPDGGGTMPDALEKQLVGRFGSIDCFETAFIEAGTGQFGSGWVWLVAKDGGLNILATPDAETPVTRGGEPLLVCDVWEHAYYLDYQHRRGDFLRAFLDHLVNWEFAAERLADSSAGR